MAYASPGDLRGRRGDVGLVQEWIRYLPGLNLNPVRQMFPASNRKFPELCPAQKFLDSGEQLVKVSDVGCRVGDLFRPQLSGSPI
jgi:hypothetical protein